LRKINVLLNVTKRLLIALSGDVLPTEGQLQRLESTLNDKNHDDDDDEDNNNNNNTKK
jgi:hypothetical protein